jgi:hypothetical protein
MVYVEKWVYYEIRKSSGFSFDGNTSTSAIALQVFNTSTKNRYANSTLDAKPWANSTRCLI